MAVGVLENSIKPVGSFGNISAGKVLFEPDGHSGNIQKIEEVGPVGLCISSRDGERQDPSGESIIASTIGADARGVPRMLHTENIIASTIGAYDGRKNHPTTQNNIACTIRANDDRCGHRGFEKSNLFAQF